VRAFGREAHLPVRSGGARAIEAPSIGPAVHLDAALEQPGIAGIGLQCPDRRPRKAVEDEQPEHPEDRPHHLPREQIAILVVIIVVAALEAGRAEADSADPHGQY